MSVETITTISPVTNKPVVERQGPTDAQFAELPKTAQKAFLKHRKTTLEERKEIVKKALDILSEREDELAREITEQMGRPIAYTGKEVSTAVARGHYLLKICDKAFEDTPGEPEQGFKRYIKKVPLGPVLIIVPWNVSVLESNETLCAVTDWTTVPIPYLCQLPHPGPSLWQQRHRKAITPNSARRGANAKGFHRRRLGQGRLPGLPLRRLQQSREACPSTRDFPRLLHRLSPWRSGSAKSRSRQS